MKQWYRYILYSVIGLAIILSLWTGWQRYYRESINDNVAVVVDWDQVVELADRQNISEKEVLSQLRSLEQGKGITGVLFKEQLLTDSFLKDIQAFTGIELLQDPMFESYQSEIEPNDTYLLTTKKEEFERIILNLKAKLPKVDSFYHEASGTYVIDTNMLKTNVGMVGLGFPAEGLNLVSDMGLSTSVQLRSWPENNPQDIVEVFSQIKPYNNIQGFLFNDKELPPHRETLAQEIGLLDVPLITVEFFPQQGLSQVASLLDKRVVRLHAISAGEMNKLTPRQAVDRFALSVTDRNARVLFVRFFLKPSSPDWLESNKSYISSLVTRLSSEGFELGQAQTFPPFATSRLVLLLIGLGAVAGGTLLLDVLGYRKWGLAAGVFLAIIWFAMLLSGQVTLGRKLFALGGTIVFPSLAVIVFTKEKSRTILQSIRALVGTSAISFIGAVFLVGLLAEKSFMLKLDQFAGVKAAFLGPPVILFIYFAFLKYEPKEWFPRIKRVLQTNISVKYALLIGVLGLIGFVYVMRSGNQGVFVSAFELKVRAFLDNLLVVRPRTKEFLVGHPLLMLVYYFGYRDDYMLPVVVVAAMGQVSLVNTFAHTWTPVAISLLRTVNGVWLGVLGGIVLILLVRLWYWWEAKYLRD